MPPRLKAMMVAGSILCALGTAPEIKAEVAPPTLGEWVQAQAVLLPTPPRAIDSKLARQSGRGYLLEDSGGNYRTYLVPLDAVQSGAGQRILARASGGTGSLLFPGQDGAPPLRIALSRLGAPYLVVTFKGSGKPDIPSKADIIFPIGRLTSSPGQQVVSLTLAPHYDDYSDLRGPTPGEVCGFDPRLVPAISMIRRACWGEVIKRASQRDTLDPYSLLPLSVDSLRRLLALRANESRLTAADSDRSLDGFIELPFREPPSDR
ncbi:MAG: hypothetical protein H6918_05030 [Sphingomonadaceae bacterium]|nr:hypothetical protein [Sphingomonadaceae bacterium]